MSNMQFDTATVAMAEYKDDSGAELALRTVAGWQGVHGPISRATEDCYTFRPLVVLDMDKHFDYDNAQVIRDIAKHNWSNGVLESIADQIEEQTKPPKPEEPTGLGAVVIANCQCNNRNTFVREPLSARFEIRQKVSDLPWKSSCGHHQWSDLTNVEVKSEGWSE